MEAPPTFLKRLANCPNRRFAFKSFAQLLTRFFDSFLGSLRPLDGPQKPSRQCTGGRPNLCAGVAAAVTAFGRLDVVVANAATETPRVTVDALSLEDWRDALDVNLTGAFLLCKHALPRLRAQKAGSIILLASQMGRVADRGQAAYCATKGALVQLAKVMAIDHAGEGIRVNALSPGGTATGRLARRFGTLERAEAEWGQVHPVGRLARPEEIARAAVFLACDESSFMTGTDLLIDGGYSAR